MGRERALVQLSLPTKPWQVSRHENEAAPIPLDQADSQEIPPSQPPVTPVMPSVHIPAPQNHDIIKQWLFYTIKYQLSTLLSNRMLEQCGLVFLFSLLGKFLLGKYYPEE